MICAVVYHLHDRDARRRSIDEPMPSITRRCRHQGQDSGLVIDDGRTGVPQTVTGKPAYSVPAMADITQLAPCGFDAASSFSGCGGSSTGYRMAGFRVLWASEFIPEAADSYRANCAPYTVVDTRDIRDVTPEDVLKATGKAAGELDLWDGSPPCGSFSMAGKREAGWGKAKTYSSTVQRSDDLFWEYARLLRGIAPRVFVAENVTGLARGTAKGMFKLIHAELAGCGYRVRAFTLDASWLGVPQARKRIIFAGVREDLGMDPVAPAPLPYRYTVRDALPYIVMQGDNGGFGGGGMRPADKPSPTIASFPAGGNSWFPPSKIIARVVHDTSGERGQGVITDDVAPTITPGVGSINSHHFQLRGTDVGQMTDPETGADLTIATFSAGAEYGPKRPRGTLWRHDADGTLAAGEVCRKLNLAELRALSGFPADFVLTGTYAQRWERVGRAVPPVMMFHLAAAIRDQILVPLREAGKI